MPGKVNPSIAEMVNQVCYQALGFDTTVALASEAGQLELNVMMPVITHNVVFGLMILGQRVAGSSPSGASTASRPTRAQCAYWLERSPALVTALAPKTRLCRGGEAREGGREPGLTVKELVAEKGLLTGEGARGGP